MIGLRKLAFLVFCAVVLSVFNSCIQSEYDLSKGLNTVVRIGGDSLALPLWADSILLKTVMTDTSIFKTIDGDLSIVRRDSMTVKVDTIKAVVFNLTPPKIDSVEVTFSDIKLKPFQLSEISLSTPLPIPDLNVKRSILPIAFSQSYTYPIVTNAQNATARRTRLIRKVKSTIIDTIQIASNGLVDQELTLDTYPIQLKRVNKIFLANNLIHILFDRSKMSNLNLTSKSEKIETFRIDFPAEYKITNPVGLGARIEGNSFIIENALLSQTSQIAEYTLNVEALDLSQTLQSNFLEYKRQIPYSFVYKFQGETSDIQSLNGKNIEVVVDFNSEPVISDLTLETNPISIANNNGEYLIHKYVSTIPKEVSSISDLTFNEGAYLEIAIQKPDISPFAFSSGYCEIQLPKMFRFRRTLNLNNATNVFRIPYNKLFQTYRLYLTGAVINQSFPEGGGDLFIDDKVSYTTTNFVLAGTAVNTSQVEKMNSLNYNFRFSTNLVNVENANMVTREITVKVPDQVMKISLHRFVSTEVEKLYSATMAKPVKMELKFDLTGLPPNIDSLFFRNYTIKMPDFLKFKEGNTNYRNEVILNRGFKVSEGFSKILELEKLDFGTDGMVINNGYLDLSESVALSGSIYIKGLNVKSADLGKVKVFPKVTVDMATLGLVDGKFNPKLSAINQTVNLNLPSYLLNDSVKLDISDPVILVDAGNPMGLPVRVDVTMTPKRSGKVLSDAVITTNVDIARAATLGALNWTKFGLAVDAADVPGNYQPLIIPGLQNLLKTIPDEIGMKMLPTVISDHHTVDLLAQKNEMSMRYEVRIPMKFGANFKFTYQNTIVGQKERLNKLLQYTNKLNLAATIGNKIPLDLKLEITPIDVAGKVIKDIVISNIEKIKAGSSDYEALSRLVVDVYEKTGTNALLNLDGFIVKVSANRDKTTAGLPIRQTQYFKLDLKVLIPDGLSVELRK